MSYNYTRQSTLATGLVITAAAFNNEYNQLLNAFAYSSSDDAATGHKHDGTSGQGGNIPLIGDIDFLNKIEINNALNLWDFNVEVGGASVSQYQLVDGAIRPTTDNDVDLGTTSLGFKDLHLTNSLVLGDFTVSSILDEDNLISDSATALATQQSIKAYVDTTFTGVTLKADADVSGNGWVVDEDTLVSNSATKVPTQQSVKAYVDTLRTYVDSEVTAQDLDVTADSGTITIDLDSETISLLGGTGLTSTASGNSVTFDINSIVTTLTETQTLTNKTLASPSITGNTTTTGLFDGRDVATDGTKLDTVETSADVTDASNVAAAGAVMESDTTTALMSFVVDEDTLVSNSATKVPTQQSVKAYVDTKTTDAFGQVNSGTFTTVSTEAAMGTDMTITQPVGTGSKVLISVFAEGEVDSFAINTSRFEYYVGYINTAGTFVKLETLRRGVIGDTHAFGAGYHMSFVVPLVLDYSMRRNTSSWVVRVAGKALAGDMNATLTSAHTTYNYRAN
jgi:hypothetical protein